LHLIPIHANLKEVEEYLERQGLTGGRALHIGAGDSAVELLWSASLNREITLTDRDKGKLSRIAGFITEYLPWMELNSEVEPSKPGVSLEQAMEALRSLRRHWRLKPDRRIITRRINIAVIDILREQANLNRLRGKYDFIFAFGYTNILHRREGRIGRFIGNIKLLLRPGGKAILSDILPMGTVARTLSRLPCTRQIGENTIVIEAGHMGTTLF